MEAIIQQALNILLAEQSDMMMAYVFGSFANDQQNADSDLDLAIFCKEKLGATERWELAQKIAAHINRDVDLVDLAEASTVMRYQIIGYGKRIYCANENACAEFEILAISMYLRFNEERKPLLEAIHKTGKIYGDK